MTLEQQVVSLELAKRLKELGVRQESLFWWEVESGGYQNIITKERISGNPSYPADLYCAFTVAELCSLLPESVGTEDHGHLHISSGTREIGKWTVG